MGLMPRAGRDGEGKRWGEGGRESHGVRKPEKGSLAAQVRKGVDKEEVGGALKAKRGQNEQRLEGAIRTHCSSRERSPEMIQLRRQATTSLPAWWQAASLSPSGALPGQSRVCFQRRPSAPLASCPGAREATRGPLRSDHPAGMPTCRAAQCGAVPCGAMQCGAVRCRAVRCRAPT